MEVESRAPEFGQASDKRALFDVRRFAASLPPEFSKLRKAAERWADFHSCSSDVTLALEFIDDALKWHKSPRSTLGHAKHALMLSAVSLYARAFDKKGKHRRVPNLRAKIPADQLEFHDQLIEIRHEFLAHFGPAGFDGPWGEDMAFVMTDFAVWLPFVSSRRSAFVPNFAIAFQVHTRTVSRLAHEIARVERDEFQSLLTEAWTEHSEIDALLWTSEVDPGVVGGWNGPVLSGDRTARKFFEMERTRLR